MGLVVGKLGQLGPGEMTSADVEGQGVAIANVGGKYFAFVDRCTHLGCTLSDGLLSESVVMCRCHGSQFNVETGDVVQGPARIALDTYELQVVGDELQLALGEAAAPEEAVPAGVTAERKSREVALTHVPLFSGLDPAALENLEAFTFRRTFKPGDLIVEEGRTGNGLYVVLSGRVEVIKGLGGANPQPLATLGDGETFGEMALLGDWPRSASVRAIDETECLGIDRWIFLAYLSKEPKLAIKVIQMLAQRLAEADKKLAEV